MLDRNSHDILRLLALLLIGSQTTAASAQDADSEDLPTISETRSVSIQAGEETKPIIIERRQPLTLVFERRVLRVDSFDPDFINVIAVDPFQLKVFDKRETGDMHLWVTDEDQVRTKVNVRIVGENLRHLDSYLDELFPEAELTLYQLNNSLLIRGVVRDQSQLEQIDEVAREFFPNVLMRAMVNGALPQFQMGRIPNGMRVVSVKVADTQTHSNMLTPGDRVDVLVTYNSRSRHGLNTMVRPLLEYVTIFSVGDKRENPGDNREGGAAVSNVSLLVTPEQASYVQLAEKKGELSLVRRNKADDEQVQVGSIDEQLMEELQGIAESDTTNSGLLFHLSEDREETAPAPDANALQTEIRALHTDVKRLIDLLEKRQSARDSNIPLQTVPTRVVPLQTVPTTSATEPPGSADLKVLYFHANWVGPSQEMLAVVDRIAAEESVEVTKIDVAQQRELADKYSIESLPTLLLLDGNDQVKRLMGNLVNETTAEELIQRISHPEYYDLWQSIGIRLKPIPAEEISDVEGLTQGGMKIVEIDRKSLAGRRSSLQVDDILVGLGTRQTSSIADVQQALLSDSRTHKLSYPATGREEELLMVMYYVLRESQQLNGYLQLDQRPSNALYFQPILSPPTLTP